MKELKFNLKLLIYRKEFYFATFVIFLVNIIQCFMAVQYSSGLNLLAENGYSAEYQTILYNNMVSLNSIIIIVFPIVCATIFSDSSWLEEKNKTFNILYSRLNIKKNNLIRYILSFLIPFIICFLGFMLNYGMMRLIFPSGTLSTFYNDVSFYLISGSEFLDNLRLENPVHYIISIISVVSLAIGLLSSLSYSFSIFFKKRVLIYFIPLLAIISLELITAGYNFGNISFLKLLQPTSHISMREVLIISTNTVLIGLSIVYIKGKQKNHII